MLISVHKLEKTNLLGPEALAFALPRTSQANMENSLRIDLIKMQSLAMNNVTAKCSFFEIWKLIISSGERFWTFPELWTPC